jgi:pimeloyl-ACP methyl ester carboxylesterase
VIDVPATASEIRLTRKVIDIDTIPIPYVEGGAGRPVVLLHLPVNPVHVYTKTMAGLAQQFHVYNLDLRPAVTFWFYEGYGTLLQYLTDYLVKALDRLELASVDVIGSFMGAGLAMSLAIQKPNRVRRLVLISPLGLTARMRGWGFGTIFALMNIPGMRFLFHLFMSSVPFQRRMLRLDEKALGLRRVREFFYDTPEEGFEYHISHLYDGLADPPNPFAFEALVNCLQHLHYKEVRRLASTIKQPTLLLFGKEDIVIPTNAPQRYQDTIPNSTLHVVPKARLFLHWEAATEVNRRINEFLGSSESSQAAKPPGGRR